MLIDQQQYCLITYSDLYGLFPTNYSEKIYFKGRPMKIDPYKKTFLTEETCKLTYNSHWQQHIIQALIYDRYELVLLCRENYAIESLEFAQSIQLYSFIEKKVFTPVIEEITKGRVSGTGFQEVKITFWDKNPDNYYNSFPIMNNLRSDVLLSRGYTAANLTKVSLVPLNHDTWSTQYDYYSPFYMKSLGKRENKQDQDLNGQLINTRITSKRQKEITIYLNESDQATFIHYATLCNSYNGRVEIKENNGASPVTMEMPDVESEEVKGAVDLYKVKLTLVYSVLNNLTYST